MWGNMVYDRNLINRILVYPPESSMLKNAKVVYILTRGFKAGIEGSQDNANMISTLN